jgi:PAS domain S-box-containing protein
MKDPSRTNKELIEENSFLKQRIQELEHLDSERKRAGEAVRLSEQQLNSYIENAGDAIYELKVDTGRILNCNSRACLDLGYSRDELVKLSATDIESSLSSGEIDAIHYDLKPGEVKTVEGTHKRKDGSVFPVEIRFSLLSPTQSGLIIAIARDITERKRMEEETAVLAEIGRLIGSTLDINEVYERFAAEVRKLIPFDRIAVNLKNPDGETSTMAYVSGFDIPGLRQGDQVPLAGTITEALFRTRTAMFLNPVSEEEVFSYFPNASAATTFRTGMRSMMAVPLISRDEVIGVLHFRAIKPNLYSEQDLHLAERIGRQITGAIANANLYSNLDRLVEEMAIIAEIGRLISSTLDIQEVYDRFAEEVQKLIPFDRLGVVTNINPIKGTYKMSYASGIDFPGRRPGDVIPLRGAFLEIIMQTRKGMINNFKGIEDMARQFPSVTSNLAIKAGLISMLSFPLISRDEVIGTLHFRSSKPNAYSKEDLRLAGRIGEQISGAIVNAQLYDELRNTHDTLEMQVRERTIELEETNTALRVLLKKEDKDQKRLEDNLQSNINQLVTPFLSKLRVSQSNQERMTYLNILEANLDNIVSPFINRLSATYQNLTPKEIQIAELVKQGKRSKEIAELFGISIGTVISHRNHIRKKLALKSRDANLRSHLLSLA